MSEIRDELDPPYEVREPAQVQGPVLFNSPHSGSTYPRAFLAASRLDIGALRRSEDSFVDELISGVVACGFPLMHAHFPRCFVDVNREPYELDPRMFEGRLPSFANTRSMRVAGGLGTVARVVGDAQEIYDQRIPVDDALRRIESLYKPYHRSLRRLFTKLHRDFGAAVLVDCHSMPSTAGHKDERSRPEFVLGDRYGTSCVGAVSETVEQTLRSLGYTVCMLSSSRSIARFTWTSVATSARPISPGWRRIWKPWHGGLVKSPSRNFDPTAPLRNNRPRSAHARRNTTMIAEDWKKKGPLAGASGPSLGRKRPRRAAAALATALQ
jgi:N-formylglutamate deformylase